MLNRGRTLTVDFTQSISRTIKADPIVAVDYGQILEIRGLDLPTAFEVHFSKDGGTSWPMIGHTENGISTVEFYNDHTKTGGVVTAYIYLHETESDGETEYTIIVPIKSRPGVTPAEPTPEQEDIIAQAITALNSAVEQTAEDAEAAAASASAAEQSAQDAQTALESAQEAQRSAESAAESASSSALSASQSATEAARSATNADQSATDAHESANSASRSASTAEDARDDALEYAGDAQRSATDAESAKETAVTKAGEAAQSAGHASTSAQDAQGYAQDANTAKADAVQAKNDAETAKTGAETAQGKAEEAQGKAETAQDNAESFAESAQASADRAEQEADRWYEFLPVDTASGSLAHFTDGADDVPVKSLSVSLEPIQDLNGQDSPYPAGGGKNLFDGEYEHMPTGSAPYYMPVNVGDGTFTLSTTAPLNTGGNSNLFFLAGNVTSGANTSTNGVSNGVPRTTTAVDGYVTIAVRAYQGVDPREYNTQLESGSTATSYAPYSNICPITGHTQVVVTRTGKNLFDASDITDYSKWSATVATGGNMPCNVGNRIYSFPALKAGVQYTISFGFSSASFPTYLYFGYYKNNETTRLAYLTTDSFLSQTYTFTALDGVTYALRMGTTLTQSQFDAQIAKIGYVQIELGSTATTYEPYFGQSITIPLGDTVYGGTLDVTNGVLTVDRGMVERTSANQWRASQTAGVYYINNGSTCRIEQTVVCDKFKGCPNKNARNLELFEIAITTDLTSIVLRTDDADVDTFKARLDEMGGFNIVRKLATPTTVQLTPQQMTTLLGINNIWSDSGDVSVDYRADVQLYIQKMIAQALNS